MDGIHRGETKQRKAAIRPARMIAFRCIAWPAGGSFNLAEFFRAAISGANTMLVKHLTNHSKQIDPLGG